LAISAQSAEVVDGLVVKYPLNIRAGAGTKHTAVGKLTKNNPVKIVAVSDQWLEIKAPANCYVWVAARYVKNNKLTARVNLRSGPGTGYEILGSGVAGQPVKVMGKVTPSGWVALSAPENVTLFVGRPAIKVQGGDQALARLPKFNARNRRALPKNNLIELEGNFTSEGKPVRLRGYIYKEGSSPVTHVLYEAKGDDLIPRYFLIPSDKAIQCRDGDNVLVTGESRTMKDWDLPVVLVRAVMPLK
jgi:uncharacterized protein YraI